jgi:hypothetical protein
MDFERHTRIRQLYAAFDLAATLVHVTRCADMLDPDTPFPEPMADLLPMEQRHQLLELA